MAHEYNDVTPSALEQLKMLLEIVQGGSASPKLASAFESTSNSSRIRVGFVTNPTNPISSSSSASASATALRALRTLPVSGYDPSYAYSCSRIIDALRSGKGEDAKEVRGALSELFSDGDRVEVCGFAVTSGTSGAARKLFPQVREAMRRRNDFFFLKEPLVAPEECRLNLFVPARAEVLSTSSSFNDDGDRASGDRVLGPATAVIFHVWMNQLTDLLEEEATDPALDFDPVRNEQQSYPLAVVVARELSVEQRLYLIWLCTLARGGSRVSLVVDTFGGSVLTAVRVLRSRGREMAKDLRAGRLVNESLFEGGESSSSPPKPSSSSPSSSKISPELRRAVDLYLGGAGESLLSEAARQLEDALAEEEREGQQNKTGLLARLLPNVRFVSAIFTGSMAKYLPPMRSLLSPLEDARIITEFFGGSEGTYGINEALLLHRDRLRGGGATTKEGSEEGRGGSPPFPPLPEPQRFVALTGADVFMEFLPLDGASSSAGDGSRTRGMIDGREDESGGGGGNGMSNEGNTAAAAALSVADGPVPPGRYELVVTSFSGLARYRVGDVIKVVGAFEPPKEEEEEQGEEEHGEKRRANGAEAERRRAVAAKVELLRGAPVFEFVGRAGSALNLVWEKFDEGAILAAVAQAAAGFAGGGGEKGWKDFACREDLAPARGGASYLFYLEGNSSSDDDDSSRSASSPSSSASSPAKLWADALEASLRSHNAIYEMLCVKKQISPLKVSLVSSGTFDSLREAAVASGTAHAQYKTPVVVEADPRGKRTILLEARVVETVQAEG